MANTGKTIYLTVPIQIGFITTLAKPLASFPGFSQNK
jgi:hypothetical protein